MTGSAIPTISVSWKASLPSSARGTLPVIATIGTESIIAVARPVTRLIAPGPDVAIATPTPLVARLNPSAAWAATLLMANEDVAKRELAEDVIDRKDGAAGIAEDRRHALPDQALADGARTDAWRDRGRCRRLIGCGES